MKKGGTKSLRNPTIKLQVLVASMHQTDFSKVEEMNLSSDTIIANQAESYKYMEKDFSFGKVRMITTEQRGVGKNRNTALDIADGDILLLADDDLKYVDNYEKIIISAFNEIPEADAIIFNIQTVGDSTYRRQNAEIKRIRMYNALNYGAVRIAFKRNKLEKAGIHFSLNFGGGALFSAGEDSLFIHDMIKKGMKLYTYPAVIAEVDQTSSTWFRGYNHKYFYDKGALFRALFGKFSYLYAVQDYLRHVNEYKKSSLTKKDIIYDIKNGIIGYKTYTPYTDSDVK